jgi:hypothetical protein
MPVDPTNDIAGFIQNFAGGGVRTNLFMVQGNIPGYGNLRAISFLCKAAQIPASSLGVIEVPYRGRRIKFPGDRTFQDWTITVISDANMSLRSAFENWSTNFNTHVSNTGAINLGPLMPTWSVTQLRRDGEPLRTYNFIGCFPSEVGAIDLSYENNDTIAEFPVTINYSYWVAAPGGPANNATGNGNLLGSLLQGAGINIGTGF